VPETEARKHPGPGAYHRETWVAPQPATHAAFVSRVPRGLTGDTGTLSGPGPYAYQRPQLWGESGRAHSMGPRAKLRLTRMTDVTGRRHYVEMAPPEPAVRWVRTTAPPSIPDGTWHGLGAWQTRLDEKRSSLTVGPGQYTPQFDAVHRRPVVVDFGKSSGRAWHDEPNSPREASRDERGRRHGAADPALVLETTTLLKYPMPTFRRHPARPGSVPFMSRVRAHGAASDDGGGADGRGEIFGGTPGPQAYDTRTKLSQPLPAFRRALGAEYRYGKLK